MHLPGLCHAHRDPLHGRVLVRHPEENDFKVLLPAAEVERKAGSGGTSQVDCEHVLVASKVTRNGDWKRCKELIINEEMNAKVGT